MTPTATENGDSSAPSPSVLAEIERIEKGEPKPESMDVPAIYVKGSEGPLLAK